MPKGKAQSEETIQSSEIDCYDRDAGIIKQRC